MSLKRKATRPDAPLRKTAIIPGLGGGLCNLANTINLLVLHSPLAVTEFHKHSDALACDVDHRKPLAAGTSIFYNYVDYRFKNTSDQNVQLCVWVANGQLTANSRSERAFPWKYALSEEDHSFSQGRRQILSHFENLQGYLRPQQLQIVQPRADLG